MELGRQVVTGSRIRRIDVEEARPVVVMRRPGKARGKGDLQRPGIVTVNLPP